MFRVMERILAAVFLILASWATPTFAENTTYWVLQEKVFLCLKNSVEVYLEASKEKSPNERILIFASKCPETNISKLFSERTQNTSSLPTVELDGQNKVKPAEIISLLPNQLLCLKSINLKVENNLVHLPKEPCL